MMLLNQIIDGLPDRRAKDEIGQSPSRGDFGEHVGLIYSTERNDLSTSAVTASLKLTFQLFSENEMLFCPFLGGNGFHGFSHECIVSSCRCMNQRHKQIRSRHFTP